MQVPATKDASLRKGISAKIKSLGFLMTCAMVCYHCPGFDATYSIGNWDTRLINLIEHFFYQMGYVSMSYFFALLIPYVIWQCIITGIDVLQKQYIFSLKDFLVRTFALVPWPQDGALWYVYAVFLLALTSPVLLLLFRNRYAGWIATMLLIIVLQARGRVTNPYISAILNHGYVENILFYLPCYLVGCYCGRFMDENTISETTACILSALFISYILEGIFPGFSADIGLKLLPLLALFVLPVIPSLQNRKVYALSFLVYAMHQPLIADAWEILQEPFMQIPMPVSMRGILIRAIILVLDIGLAAIMYSVLKRFLPKFLAFLTGGRF